MRDDSIVKIMLLGMLMATVVAMVLTSGCFFLSNVEESSGSKIIQVQAGDATASATGDTFDGGDDVIFIEHQGGDVIDWNTMIVKIQPRGSDVEQTLVVSSITASPISVDNHESSPGDIIVCTMPGSAGSPGFTLNSGDYVDVNIYEGLNKVYSKMDLRVE